MGLALLGSVALLEELCHWGRFEVSGALSAPAEPDAGPQLFTLHLVCLLPAARLPTMTIMDNYLNCKSDTI